MTKFIFGAALVLFASTTFAKIAIVDINKILELSPQAKAADARIKKKFAPNQQKLNAMRKEIAALEKQLSKDGVTMSREKYIDLEIKIQKKKRQFKRFAADVREDLAIHKRKEYQEFMKKVYAAVKVVAKKEKIQIVFRRNKATMYYDPAIDITKKVIGAMK